MTEYFLCSSSFNSVIVFFGTSMELFCNKVVLTMLRSVLLTFLELFSDKVSCTVIYFDSSSSVTLKFDNGAVISV